jgi:hypothetical protein
MLELFELGTDGSIITGVFRRFKDQEKGLLLAHENASKGLMCPVVVKNPTFTYGMKR